jgi:hypothetical protein
VLLSGLKSFGTTTVYTLLSVEVCMWVGLGSEEARKAAVCELKVWLCSLNLQGVKTSCMHARMHVHAQHAESKRACSMRAPCKLQQPANQSILPDRLQRQEPPSGLRNSSMLVLEIRAFGASRRRRDQQAASRRHRSTRQQGVHRHACGRRGSPHGRRRLAPALVRHQAQEHPGEGWLAMRLLCWLVMEGG